MQHNACTLACTLCHVVIVKQQLDYDTKMSSRKRKKLWKLVQAEGYRMHQEISNYWRPGCLVNMMASYHAFSLLQTETPRTPSLAASLVPS